MRKLLQLLLIVLCLLGASIFGLLYTNAGLRLVLKLIPGTLSYQTATGNIAQQLEINTLHYQYNNITLDVDSTELHWNIWGLLSKKVQINAMNISGATIHLPNSTQSIQGKASLFGAIDLNTWLNSNATLTADLTTPKNSKLNLSLKDHELKLASTGLLDGTASITAKNTLSGTWQLKLNNSSNVLPILNDNLSSNGNISGTLDQHTINIHLAINEDSTISSKLVGGLINNRWEGNVQRLAVNHPIIDRLTLTQPAAINLSKSNYQLSHLCLANSVSSSCIELHYNGADLSSSLDLEKIDLALLHELIPTLPSPTGTINGTLKLNYIGKNSQWDGSLAATTSDGTIHYMRDGSQHTFAFDPSTISLALNQNGSTLALATHLPNKTAITVNLQSDYVGIGLPEKGNTLKGSITGHANSFSFLQLLAQQIDKPSGELTLDTKIDGTIGKPLLSGGIQVANGQAYIIPLGVTCTDINLSLSANNSSTVSLTGALSSQKGKLYINGESNLSQPDYPTTIMLKGNNATVFDTNEYTITASPNLRIKIKNNTISLLGNIALPSVIITPKDFSSTVTLPNDVIIDQNNKDESTPDQSYFDITTNILFNSSNIKVNYRGLDATLSGKIRLIQSPNTPTQGQGQLTIEKGAYQAYGQELEINQGGSLTFTNSLGNPTLNLTASKAIQIDNSQNSDLPSYQRELIVGINVTGTLNQPNVTLFSDPSGYSEQNILSYLVFGFPQNQLNNSQSALIWQAVNSLNAGKNSVGSLKSSLQKTLGLNQLTLSSATEYNPETDTEETGTSLVVGKRINDRLSVTYSMGLAVPVNILYVRYQLSKKFALQSDSSTYGNGADLLYSFSKD